MPIDKIAFKGVETSIQSQQDVKKEETQKQLEPVDKGKSNAAKYMIGATALAAVIGIGIAGRKGHLGEGVQKLLGGAKKSSDDIAETGEKKGGEIVGNISSKANDTPSGVVTNETAAQTVNAIKRKINPELIEDKDLRKVIEKLDSDTSADFANKDNSTYCAYSYIGKLKKNLYITLLERFANYKSPSELSKAIDELSAKKYNISVKALENCADNVDFESILKSLNDNDLRSELVIPKDVEPQEKLRIILNTVAESSKERLMTRIKFHIPKIDSNATQAEKTEMIEKHYTEIVEDLKKTLEFLTLY